MNLKLQAASQKRAKAEVRNKITLNRLQLDKAVNDEKGYYKKGNSKLLKVGMSEYKGIE